MSVWLGLALVLFLPGRQAQARADAGALAALRDCVGIGGKPEFATPGSDEKCAGLLAAACQSASPGGETTAGILQCLGREMRSWGAASMRQIAAAQCLLAQTAERAIQPWAYGRS